MKPELSQILAPPIDGSRRDVIDACYQRFGKAALSKLKQLVGREDIAHELLQEVFIKLWQKGPIFQDEKMLYGWIYRSCHNSGIDYLRSAVYRRESVSHMQEQDFRTDEFDLVGVSISRDTVRRLCKKLSQQEAQIVMYVGIDEMTHEEAADMLGISKKTVTRAILRMRQMVTVKEVLNEK